MEQTKNYGVLITAKEKGSRSKVGLDPGGSCSFISEPWANQGRGSICQEAAWPVSRFPCDRAQYPATGWLVERACA